MFLTEHEEYQSVLARLREERSRIAPLLPQVPAALRKAYEQETPPCSIILMNRVEECAPVRMDAPLNLLAERGSVSLTGCMSAKDTPLELYDVTSMYDSIILFERANLMPTANVRQMLAEAASHGSIVLQEMDDHPNMKRRRVIIIFSFAPFLRYRPQRSIWPIICGNLIPMSISLKINWQSCRPRAATMKTHRRQRFSSVR